MHTRPQPTPAALLLKVIPGSVGDREIGCRGDAWLPLATSSLESKGRVVGVAVGACGQPHVFRKDGAGASCTRGVFRMGHCPKGGTLCTCKDNRLESFREFRENYARGNSEVNTKLSVE